ncbi:hypothetical protein [Streptomyces sp. NPDC097981]|uniref:hypothetical protein n=1 Tax=Streptomyces sp. NPDC097981 TaxID=3155428 RepID=UPI00331A7068
MAVTRGAAGAVPEAGPAGVSGRPEASGTGTAGAGATARWIRGPGIRTEGSGSAGTYVGVVGVGVRTREGMGGTGAAGAGSPGTAAGTGPAGASGAPISGRRTGVCGRADAARWTRRTSGRCIPVPVVGGTTGTGTFGTP